MAVTGADTGTAQLTPAVERPAHVPESLVYDFDMLMDPELLRDPHARHGQLLVEAPPVFWTPRGGGHWMINGYQVIFDAAREWESFSSQLHSPADVKAMMEMMPTGGERIPRAVPISLDPPTHGRFRMPLNNAFAPKVIAGLAEEIRDLAIHLIDQVVPYGRCEFMSAIGESLPVQVFLKLMGLPIEHQAEYRALTRRMLSAPGGNAAMTVPILQEIASCMRETIVERRDNPRDDLISRLWKTEVDHHPATQDDVENYCVLLFLAGLDTVMNGMGFGVRHLARDQALQERLRADPTLIPEAVEELLRRYGFVTTARRVAKDVVFHGVEMKQHDRVYLNLAGANLDPQRWPEADRVDLDRSDKAHIAFNVGPHRCVGSHLARLELRTLYTELLARTPRFSLDPERPPTFHGGVALGFESLDLVWDR